MQITKEKPKIDPVLDAHIRAIGQKIEQNDRYTDPLKSCGKEPKTANFETENSKVIFPILPESVCSSHSSTRFIDTCKIEEKSLNLLRNKNTSRSSRILIEKRSKPIPCWVTESCSCLLTPEDWN